MSALHPKSSNAWMVAALALALMAGAGVLLARMQTAQRLGPPGVKLEAREVFNDSGKVFATNAVYFPPDLPGYRSTNPPISQVEIDWLPKDTTFGRATYLSSNGFQATMNAVLMGADRTSIHKPEYCLVGQGFHVDSQQEGTIRIQEPVPYDLPILKMLTSREEKLPDGSISRIRAVYIYWFVADGRLAADHNKRMLSMATDMLRTGVLQRWAYISCLSIGPIGQEDQISAEMEKLIAAAVPRFQLTTGASAPASVAQKY
jgi:hypothetical protein